LNYANINKEKIIAEEDLDKMMEDVKNGEENFIYVVTCFSDRMKFMDRR
jgi:hypothetical protein